MDRANSSAGTDWWIIQALPLAKVKPTLKCSPIFYSSLWGGLSSTFLTAPHLLQLPTWDVCFPCNGGWQENSLVNLLHMSPSLRVLLRELRLGQPPDQGAHLLVVRFISYFVVTGPNRPTTGFYYWSDAMWRCWPGLTGRTKLLLWRVRVAVLEME